MRETGRQARQQLRVLSNQTAILRSQQDPLLKVHAFSFDGNKLSAKMINRGKGRARLIGVESFFYPTVFQPKDVGGKPIPRTDELLEEAKAQKSKLRGELLEQPRHPLRHKKWSKGEMVPYVSFFSSVLTGDSMLDPGEDQEFTLRNEEPVFKIVLDNQNFVQVKFTDLKAIVQENGFQFVSLWFRMVCKDAVDRPVYGQSFRFVASMNSHQTLQDAMSEGLSTRYHMVDRHEADRELGGIDAELYKWERAVENFPEEQREKVELDELSRSKILGKNRRRRFWSRH